MPSNKPSWGDTNPWRDLGYVKWYDSYSVLEDPNSVEFANAVDEETTKWNTAVKSMKHQVRSWEHAIQKYTQNALPESPEYAQEHTVWRGIPIHIQHAPGHRLNVWFSNGPTYIGLSDFGTDPDGAYYFTIRDVGSGSETLELAVYTYIQSKPLWTEKPVGPKAGFMNDRIVFQNVENQLRYPSIHTATKTYGTQRTTVYTNKDKRFQVDLYPKEGTIFFRIQNALDQRLGKLVGHTGYTWITSMKHTTLIPISTTIYAQDNAIVMKHRTYPLPAHQHLVDAVERGTDVYVTTVHMGYMRLYVFIKESKTYTLLHNSTIPNEIMLHDYDNNVSLATPNKPTTICAIHHQVLTPIQTLPEPLALPYVYSGTAVSKDGTRVPYTYVSTHPHPTRLIVEGYGSYGISAHRSYPVRWLAWIARGYGYAVSMPRGGRDNGDMWYDGGRTAQRKQNTIDDTASVIKAVQHKYNISPKRTIFYGRSAGGLLAANIAQQYPHLVGAIYAEVPYLDVLRTTTNPNLPLTQLEYDEFGDPAKRPEDYASLQSISPVDSVPVAPSHAPRIVIKTAVHDVQVLPYESLKWAKKLRASGWDVYVGIDDAGGHFAATSVASHQQATDAVLLSTSLSRSVSTRKLRPHVSKGTKRRRVNSRKHR